jgi:hypothetical protein
MVNKCNKNKEVIKRLLLAETDAGKKLQVTKPAVPQTSLKSTNMQGKAKSIPSTPGEALRILHQNIQGLRWKSNEVIDSVYPNLPHILCFTEHHLNQHELNLIQIDSYTLGASFSRNFFKMGGVCIFVNNNLNFMNIDLQKFSHERDIEVGAVKIFVNSANICILSIYRAPSGNFALFLDKLEMVLNLLHKNNTNLLSVEI